MTVTASRLPNTPVTRSRGRALKVTPQKATEEDAEEPKATPARKGRRSSLPLDLSASKSITEISIPPKSGESASKSTLAQSLQSSIGLEEEFEHEDWDALAAAVSDNLEARLRQRNDTPTDDGIRAIFENTKTKRPESYGAFVVEKGVVQLGALPVGHDSRNLIASIASQNKVAVPTAEATVQPKTFAMPTTRVVTTGADWFNMKSPEMTPELKTDLAIIANRAYLNPKRFYKKEGAKKLAVHFQIGTVVAGAHEFYSSLSHKERSKNYVEEIYKDTTTKSYLKRKYGQIQATKSMKNHKKKFHSKKRGKK